MEGANEGKSFYLKAEKAIKAGCEMILVCNNRNGVLDASRYFEENNIVPSEKNFSMLMADDVSWASLEKNENRNRISNKLEKLK
jgi:beta-N-acetylhexosaminidase